MPKLVPQERITLAEAARRVALTKRACGILVVESDPDQQARAARMLTLEGRRVVGSGYGEDALALLSQWTVDLVLVSERLPGMDGIELAQEIAELMPEVPVVLVVEAGAKEHPAASLVGAVACLTKPFRLEAVRELLRSLDLEPRASVVPAE